MRLILLRFILLSITFSLYAGAYSDDEKMSCSDEKMSCSTASTTITEVNDIPVQEIPIENSDKKRPIRKMSELYTNPDISPPQMVIKFYGYKIDFENDPLLASIAEYYGSNCIKIMKALENALPEFIKNPRLSKLPEIIADANNLTLFVLQNGTAIVYQKL